MLGGEGHTGVEPGMAAGQVGGGESYFSFLDGYTHSCFWVKDGRDKLATSKSWETGR